MRTRAKDSASSMKTVTFATKLPADLTATLNDLCKRLGLRKNALVEAALREKLEDLLDAHDLRDAVATETRFHSWSSVKAELLAGSASQPAAPKRAPSRRPRNPRRTPSK